MKSLLGVVLLFAVGVHHVDGRRYKLQKRGSEEEQDKIRKGSTAQFNQQRQELAGKLGISIPELKWDDELFGIAAHAPKDCKERTHGPHFRIALDGGNENGVKMIEEYMDKMSQLAMAGEAAKLDQFLAENIFRMDPMNPLQTKFACIRNECTMDGDVKFGLICIFGPSPSWPPNFGQKLVEKKEVVKEYRENKPKQQVPVKVVEKTDGEVSKDSGGSEKKEAPAAKSSEATTVAKSSGSFGSAVSIGFVVLMSLMML